MASHVFMLGDSAWLVQWPEAEKLDAWVHQVHALMHSLHHSPDQPIGVRSIIAAYESLAVRYDPGIADGHAVRNWITRCLEMPADPSGRVGDLHEIPVCYGGENGPDLDAVAEACGITPEEVISIHSTAEYTVAMMGFAPGFPYLTGLDHRLRVPRLTTPRNRVDAGSVAIAGEQTGIYPCASPGGWRVIGRTDARLFDARRAHAPSLMKPGDRVKFVPARHLDSAPPRVETIPHQGDIEVLAPGYGTTVQDAGRPFFESIGVSPGGVLDREALHAANLLLGNPADAAVLELCVNGPSLRFEQQGRVVLVGADASGGLRHGCAQQIMAGKVLDIGSLIGSLRAILAIQGGIDVPDVMESRSTDQRAGFGGLSGRVLRAGDFLTLGKASGSPPSVAGVALARPCGRDLTIRYVAGPQTCWFTPDAIRRFEGGCFEVTTRQDRMGMRLQGERLEVTMTREMRSQPVCTGSIQIPPDGRPMVLLAERQTHGGYPQIGCVISADQSKLARALPGTRIHFRPVTLEDAWQALHECHRDLQWLNAGLMCRSESAPSCEPTPHPS